MSKPFCALLAILSTLPVAPTAEARSLRSGGKLLLTNGVTTVEGAAGGGLSSWAVIAGNETDAGVGLSAHVSYVPLPDFSLRTYGAAFGMFDRLEFSYANQRFDTKAAGAALGLGRGFLFGQDVFGAKLRVAGDAIYAQDSVLPQISVGVQHKRADKGAVIRLVGGRHSSGTDYYVAATKLLLDRGLLVNGTVRFTKANQLGLLGFGGDRQSSYTAQFEGSAALMLSRRLVVGGEYRTKPSNLGFAREDDVYDVFAAYAITPNVSLTAAYVDLGSIATVKGQRGAFLSIQASY